MSMIAIIFEQSGQTGYIEPAPEENVDYVWRYWGNDSRVSGYLKGLNKTTHLKPGEGYDQDTIEDIEVDLTDKEAEDRLYLIREHLTALTPVWDVEIGEKSG